MIQTTPCITGARADERLSVRPSEVEVYARTILQALRAQTTPPENVATHGTWVQALVDDLLAHRGSSLVVPGEYQSPAVHALAHAINFELGNVGKTVVYTEPVEACPLDRTGQVVGHLESLRALVEDMDAGNVKTLLILGGNPVYTAPSDFEFAAKLHKVAFLRIWGRTRMRRLIIVIGIFPNRITWNRGAMRGLSMGRRASFSR